ncbi:MAG: family 20 glycosylhydrolase [Candidatus Lokiarchaeota archaeon]|nr:family 20 glycosylhydrolase [Candidatus Lokiarchaeota archaeon]
MKNQIHVIPKPVKIESNSNSFLLTNDTKIVFTKDIEPLGECLILLLKSATNYSLQKKKVENGKDIKTENNAICLSLNDSYKKMGPEGYFLEVTEDKISISSISANGVFYGIQTLRQLLPPEIESQIKSDNIIWQVPCVKITDYPKFLWRGFMLDESRHFFGSEIVKKLLDLMALLKMNKFHWGLTNDQGWRIEIKKYPKLTEIGSVRQASQIGGFASPFRKRDPHGGFYTQQEIKEIIEYAKQRFIQIIPEIDMPGHISSAIAAYPELSCREERIDVPYTFGIKKDILCVGKEKVFDFAKDVLREVIELFPSDIIHIGGDEVPKSRWKNCPKCQRRIRDEGLANEQELQVYFTNRIIKFLDEHGKTAIGWNEFLGDNLLETAIGQYWMKDFDAVMQHLRRGRKFIMSKFAKTYLDYNHGVTSLKTVYNYNPIPKNLEADYHENILGIEAPLWTEWVASKNHLERLTFPRLIAIAEANWTMKDKKSFEEFKIRLASFLKRLDFLDVHYAPLWIADPNIFVKLIGYISFFLGTFDIF